MMLNKKEIETLKTISQEFKICERCLARFFIKKFPNRDTNTIGKIIKEKYKIKTCKKCMICEGKYYKESFNYLESLKEKLEHIKYNNFSISHIIPRKNELLDLYIKKKYDLKWGITLKTELNHIIGINLDKNKFSQKDFDINIIINLIKNNIEIKKKNLKISAKIIIKKWDAEKFKNIILDLFDGEDLIFIYPFSEIYENINKTKNPIV